MKNLLKRLKNQTLQLLIVLVKFISHHFHSTIIVVYITVLISTITVLISTITVLISTITVLMSTITVLISTITVLISTIPMPKKGRVLKSNSVLEITVGLWPFSDQFQHLADQNLF